MTKRKAIEKINKQEDLENATVGYDEKGNEVKGESLCKWAFDLLYANIKLINETK